ncbi:MAG: ComEC/Rec2 family competence protein, partial [Geodermatophilaceae bacterium]
MAPLLSAGLLLGVALVAVLACLSALLVGRLRRCAARDATGPRRSAAVALALAGLGLTAGTSVSHIHARDTSPLRQLATGEADVRLQLRVTEAVRTLAQGASGARVLVPGTVVALTCEPCADSALRSWILSGEVLVFAPAQEWAELVPGTTVSATVSIATAAPQDMLVGIAFARGPPEATVAPDGVLESVAAEIRGALRERADQTLDSDEAGLLRGIVLGDTAGMDAVLVEDFRISGLSHLTAVSGTNCAIVIGAVLWPLRRSRFRPVTRAVICALALAAFVVLVGPQPSVLRAAAMGAVTLLALATGRTRQAIPALAAAILVLLSFDPALARDLGFALSVAATAGIIVAAGVWAQQLRARGVPEPLAVATSVCAAAGLFTAPLLVLIVGRVSLISLPANLLVVPVVAIVTVVGLAAALITPFSPWLGEVLLRLVDWPLRWMVWIAERAARTPGAVVPWPSGVGGALALATVIVVSVFVLRRRRVRWLAAAVCVGVAVSGLSIRVLAPAWPPAGWAMVACDVGQGDALVVGLGAGRAVVLDAGPDPVLVDGCLRRLGV